jgi:hypothetical protein
MRRANPEVLADLFVQSAGTEKYLVALAMQAN